MADLLLIGLTLLAVAISLLVGYFIGRALTTRSKELEFRDRERGIRDDSTRKQRASLKGQFIEQLAPFLPNFPYDPTEAHFLGDPVDFIVFRGRSSGVCDQVVFLEVKTGTSSLSSIQRKVRDAIAEGRVRWEEYRVQA
jgi:predicted Holliday junction resolvase-like endonuclease